MVDRHRFSRIGRGLNYLVPEIVSHRELPISKEGGRRLRKHALDVLITVHVQPFLVSNGFSRSSRIFTRCRGQLYDRINFQGSRSNTGSPQDRFYVNIGVGSQEMDAFYLWWNNNREPSREYVLNKRWEDLVESVPAEVTIGQQSTELPRMILSKLDRTPASIDALRAT